MKGALSKYEEIGHWYNFEIITKLIQIEIVVETCLVSFFVSVNKMGNFVPVTFDYRTV